MNLEDQIKFRKSETYEMMTTLNKVVMPATKDFIVDTCVDSDVDASLMCLVLLRFDQHQVPFRMDAGLVESGRVILGRAWQGDWKSDWSWVGSQEGKATGWTWIDTVNSPRSKAEGKVVTNTASGEKQVK